MTGFATVVVDLRLEVGNGLLEGFEIQGRRRGVGTAIERTGRGRGTGLYQAITMPGAGCLNGTRIEQVPDGRPDEVRDDRKHCAHRSEGLDGLGHGDDPRWELPKQLGENRDEP
jgi:hypothetical protein